MDKPVIHYVVEEAIALGGIKNILGDAVCHAKSFVGEEPFALLRCTAELISKYEEFKTAIIAVE